ncbi:DUF4236 domain-containing protein [Paenibacillus sp. 32O-W]|uniref:DUF4236 domain-containing protein n=1 Tax=Paenibacillus sp. 32O-W TaxID=1695218 RepID=UPI0011A082A9
MSFYSRKSVSFGGVRLTFAKSGIGASVGIRGFRIGTGHVVTTFVSVQMGFLTKP